LFFKLYPDLTLKEFYNRYIGDLFINRRWFAALIVGVIAFTVSFFVKLLFLPVLFGVAVIFFLTFVDYILLFFTKHKITGERILPGRFSLGDQNHVTLKLRNPFFFTVNLILIDEQPVQMQNRTFSLTRKVRVREDAELSYVMVPTTRGEYVFGNLLCYVASPLGLLQRRFTVAEADTVKVYPSFHQLKKYTLIAASGSVIPGVKKIRKLGHSLEFEKIKDYVQGDDIRTINWKATARANQLMVNTFTDTRQQVIYCLIDKGRNMKMPFEEMTLLDYSINASLALLNVALIKHDKAGLVTFSSTINEIIVAERRNSQLQQIVEALYKQQTGFAESDYELVFLKIHRLIAQRAFLVLFTNFETMAGMERQLPYLRKLAQRHLVCVVFFKNTLLETIHETTPDTLEGIYIKTIAEQFDYEKRQIVKELRRHGILSVLTTPQDLSVVVINQYLELKSKNLL
jgi:uncharacterized protein (DUF58 family)